MANEHAAFQRYLVVAAAESAWGTINGTPAYRHLPVDEYSVKLVPETRQSTPHTGVRERRHNVMFRSRLDGNLVCKAYGYQVSDVSLFQMLIDWANTCSGVTMQSRTTEWYDSLEVKRHLGLRVNTWSISGQAGGPIMVSLGLMGKDEASVSAGSAQALSSTVTPEKSEFLFEDITATLSGSAVDIASFSLSGNNNLREHFLGGSGAGGGARRAVLSAGMRTLDFQIQLLHTATTRDALIRTGGIANTTGQLQLRGLHNGSGGSGTKTLCTIDFDVLSLVNAEQTESDINELISEPISYAVLKPSTTDGSVDFTWANE